MRKHSYLSVLVFLLLLAGESGAEVLSTVLQRADAARQPDVCLQVGDSLQDSLQAVPEANAVIEEVVDTVAADTVAADTRVLMRDVFREMPDSIFVYLTANNRLDCIDFLDSHMKAEVTNRMGGKSELLAMTDDSLSLRLSPGLLVSMLLLECTDTLSQTNAEQGQQTELSASSNQLSEPSGSSNQVSEPSASSNQVICMARVYGTDSLSLDTRLSFYKAENWEPLTAVPHLSAQDCKRVERLKMQTIVNWPFNFLKKD
ncbi:MAG: DUF3256 family protein [Prevotella sp.]|nr:DUF3256 family protein [Prevotella sp.]